MGIGVRSPLAQFGALRVGQRQGLWTRIRLLSNAIPDVLDELEALWDGEIVVVERWMDHVRNMASGPGTSTENDCTCRRCGITPQLTCKESNKAPAPAGAIRGCVRKSVDIQAVTAGNRLTRPRWPLA
jgi:hypothetical protein